jgi:hypothetical protein
MVAEVCSRFGGYPSTYIKTRTWGELFYDHGCFKALVKNEAIKLEALQNG